MNFISKFLNRKSEEKRLKEFARSEMQGYRKIFQSFPDAPNFNKRKSGGVIPGYSLVFYEQLASPYNVRIRFQDTQGAFDWQADIVSADWQALIAAVTGLVGQAGGTYTIPNTNYTSTIKYAGAVPPNDYTS